MDLEEVAKQKQKLHFSICACRVHMILRQRGVILVIAAGFGPPGRRVMGGGELKVISHSLTLPPEEGLADLMFHET